VFVGNPLKADAISFQLHRLCCSQRKFEIQVVHMLFRSKFDFLYNLAWQISKATLAKNNFRHIGHRSNLICCMCPCFGVLVSDGPVA
jgi:hypothetical protein